MRRAEEFLMDEMPIIPLCFNRFYFLSRKHLKGIHISPSTDLDFRYAYFE